MSPEEVAEVWDRLPRPSSVEHLEAAETADGSGVWLTLDHAGQRHLLVEVPDSTEAPPARTKGLSSSVRRHRISEKPDADFIDLTCLDEAAQETFCVVVADLVGDLAGVMPDARAAAVADTLARWRWFWGDSSSRLSEREAVGLFAELWFLDQWAGASPATIDAWGGSENTRHDFQWRDYSVEVKASSTRGEGATVHAVQHLEQLADPETGDLYLFSMRVVRDRLAANTLATLVRRCSEQLAGYPVARDSFLSKVSRLGYNPVDQTLRESSYRVVEELLFTVSDGFPRLTIETFTSGLPAGVVDVSYKIDLSACGQWLVTDRSSDWPDVALSTSGKERGLNAHE